MGRRNAIEEPIINLTPLIDVVFVILIMFILVAPLLERDQIELAQASKEGEKGMSLVQESSPITLHIRRDNTILFNQQIVSLQELSELLKSNRKKYPQARPHLFPDRKAHFETYQQVKNRLEEAGFEQVDIVLIPSGKIDG